MNWVKVLSQESLAPGAREVVKVGKQNILVINHSGEIFAVDNKCPHLKLSLKKGKITEDGSIVCRWHRSSFDLRSGEVKEWCTFPPVVGSVLGKVSEQKSLSVFPTRVEDGNILIGVEEE